MIDAWRVKLLLLCAINLVSQLYIIWNNQMDPSYNLGSVAQKKLQNV